MKIDWINNDKSSAVTIYNNNITLSKQAASFFEDAFGVAVGIDVDTNNIIIQKIYKEDFEKQSIDDNNLHKIEIKSSYGRINSKNLVTKLSEKLGLIFDKNQSYKFNAKWNTGYKMLIVSTNGKENEE